MIQDRRRHAVLLQKIIGECQRGGKALVTVSRTVLGRVWRCFQGEGSVCDQLAEGFERSPGNWHTFTARQVAMESKR